MAIKKGFSYRKPVDKEKAKAYLEERMAKIVAAIRIGLTINNAARAAGVDPGTIYYWKIQAEKGKEPYATVWQSYEQAIAEGERALAGKIAKASDNDWRAAAWILERRHPENWGKQTDVSLNGSLNLAVGKMTDEELEIEIQKARRELEDGNQGNQ